MELIRDENRITVAGGRSSTSATTVLPFRIDATTGRLLTDAASGSGTVTDVSVVSANGFAGTVADSTTTPAITLSTTVTGILSGNGTAISAASTTGSGAVVLATSPTLVTPNLGTPSTLVGTNITGTAAGLTAGTASAVAVGGITGLGTGVATALAVNTGSAGAVVLFNGALGTPSSGTVTNLTGTASININGTVGATTPSTGVFTTATVNTGLEVQNTDTTVTRSDAGIIAVEGVPVVNTTTAQTITSKRNQPRTASSTSNANLDPDLSTANVYFRTTQTTGLTIGAPTGTPVIGETIAIYVDSAGAQTLTMNATYVAFGSAFPASTTAGKTLMIVAQYNGTNWKTTWANAV